MGFLKRIIANKVVHVLRGLDKDVKASLFSEYEKAIDNFNRSFKEVTKKGRDAYN